MAIENFDALEYRSRLSALLGVAESSVRVEVTSASVLITAVVATASAEVASTVMTELAAMTIASLSEALLVQLQHIEVPTLMLRREASLMPPSSPLALGQDNTLTPDALGLAESDSESSGRLPTDAMIAIVIAACLAGLAMAVRMLVWHRRFKPQGWLRRTPSRFRMSVEPMVNEVPLTSTSGSLRLSFHEPTVTPLNPEALSKMPQPTKPAVSAAREEMQTAATFGSPTMEGLPSTYV